MQNPRGKQLGCPEDRNVPLSPPKREKIRREINIDQVLIGLYCPGHLTFHHPITTKCFKFPPFPWPFQRFEDLRSTHELPGLFCVMPGGCMVAGNEIPQTKSSLLPEPSLLWSGAAWPIKERLFGRPQTSPMTACISLRSL